MIIPRRALPFAFFAPPGEDARAWAHVRGATLIPGVVSDASAVYCTRDKVNAVATVLECEVNETALAPYDTIEASDWPGLETFDAKIAPLMRAYQPQGSVFLASKSSAMLCDEMRLGKIIETLGASVLVGSKQTFVATLGTPKRGWGEDTARWLGENTLMLDGRSADDMWWFCATCRGTGVVQGARPSNDQLLGGAVIESGRCASCRGRGFMRTKEPWEALLRARVVVSNYDILIPHRETDLAGVVRHRHDLPGWTNAIRKHGAPDTIVLDESHKIGDKGMRHRMVRELCALSSVRRVWTNTGTPTDGKMIKLYSQLDLITGGMWGTYKQFGKRYCDGFDSEFGFRIPKNGRSPLADTELADCLRYVKIARTKREVAPHLPMIDRQVVRIKDSLTKTDGSRLQAPGVAGCEAMLNRTAERKLKHGGPLDMMLQTMREGNKSVLFVRNRAPGHVIAQQMTSAIKSVREPALRNRNANVWDCIGTSYERRVNMADAFSKHEGAGFFIATIDGFQTGRSLHGVAYNFFFDLHWDPTAIHQCEKRADTFERPTGLISIFFVLEESGDEDVISVVIPKLDALWSVFGNQAASDMREVLSPKESLEQIWARHTAHLRGDAREVTVY